MPPPPPPPAPPPLPKQPFGASNTHGKSNNDPPPDRNALLSQIRKGARLKKSETNDRSAPLVDANRSSNTAAKRSNETKANGPFPIIPPGGLFAQGIPKLRPTTPRSDNSSNPPLSMVIQSIKQSNTNSSLRVNQLSGSRSQPPSPVSKPRTAAAAVTNRTVNSENSESSSTAGGNPNFPDDITIKGPAPAPPPQSQKPVFRSNTNTEANNTVKHSAVKRSASQTNLQRPRLTRPPPSEKPPPPPKSNPAPPSNAPPPPPSKPPNIIRRQSFGVGESHNSRFVTSKLSVANATPKSNSKVIGPPPPPPPPRNNSAPHDLNQMVQSSSPSNHLTKMNIAPPPPPNRAPAMSARAAPIRPPPPRAPAPPPPPPPQHHFPVHPAPPSQLKAIPNSSLAPPPPARISSIKQLDIEDRFKSMFCSAQSLPKPEKFTNFPKSYPSRMARQKTNTRRQPPPPPPQVGSGLTDRSRSHPVLPVQSDSGIFSGNYS